jgi:hypothetical protein
MTVRICVFAFGIVAGISGVAHAQDTGATSETILTPIERREPDSFRGRTNHTDAADVGLWFPRVLLSPLWVLTEFGLRIPVYETLSFLDDHKVIAWVANDLFKPTPNITWYPQISADLGVFIAAGAGIDFRNLGARDHTLSLSAAAGGPDVWFLSARDDWKAGPARVGISGRGYSRGDRAFYGLGPNSSEDDRTNFTEELIEGFGYASLNQKEHFHLTASAGFRAERSSGTDDQPSIETRFDTSRIPGFGKTNLAMSNVNLVLDSRKNVRDSGGGVRLVANATYGRDVIDHEREFVSGSADAEVAVEVMKPGRVLTLRGFVSDSAPLGREPVPFLEQSMLGWHNHLGFIWGRFRDEAAALAEIRYRYPVAFFVDMEWVASAANVFDRKFSDFDIKKLTGSVGVGFRTRRTGLTPLELIVALGTTRFDEAFSIDSVRVYLSTTGDL